jgi:hypothetical protein
MLSGLVTADKANRLDPRIIAQVVDCLWASMNDADDSWGYSCFFGQLDEHGRCARVTFGRLDEQRVAACDGDRKGPERNHGWIAEKRYVGKERIASKHFDSNGLTREVEAGAR